MSVAAPEPDDPIPSLSVLWSIPVWPEPWAAAALGLSVEQLQEYRYKKDLPATKLGKHPYYLRDSVIAWFQANEKTKV